MEIVFVNKTSLFPGKKDRTKSADDYWKLGKFPAPVVAIYTCPIFLAATFCFIVDD